MSQRTISPLSKLILGGVNGVLSNVSDNFDELYAAGGGPPEGTAILSTGEVGGTKFLREDGDGTCSWQTASGSVAWGGVTGTLSNQTDLQSALDGKSSTSHDHTGTYEPANANIQSHIGSAHAPSDAQKNSNILKSEIEAVLTGEISSHTHAGGGAGQLIHTYVSDETSLVATNQPTAERFFLNTHRYIILLDLTNYTQCRLIVNKQGTAANAGAVMTMKYRAAGFDTSVGNYSDIGTSAVTVATDATNTILNSGWINLAVGAIADVAVCVTETGGDAVLDPQYGSVILQFK